MAATNLSGRPLLDTPQDAHLFVDREAEVRSVLSSTGAGLNTIVFGAKGIGKTSFLRYLLWSLREHGQAPDASSATYCDAS